MELRKRLTEQAKKLGGGFINFLSGRIIKKEKSKEKIIFYIEEHKKATNEDIRRLLNVSQRSVVNYMNELQKESKIEQVGKTGRSVYYRFKNN